MAKVLFVADIHIKLGQKKVPKDWQIKRIGMLAEELNKVEKDFTIIGGDLLDVADPSVDEIGVMYEFLDQIEGSKVIIPGNHEMVTKTRDCYHMLETMLKSVQTTVIREFDSFENIDFIPYNVLYKNFKPKNKLAVTHVRGEIPPHVQPEVDLEIFSHYDKVFTGDLHSYQNSQLNLLYPGSPYSTSFHRTMPKNTNGYFIFDTITGEHEWFELNLPQLIRKTVSSEEEMVKDDYHHTIFELEGELEDLAKVKNSELLDKKITKNISAPATLEMSGDIAEELAEFLARIKDINNVEDYITLFKGVIKNDND